MQEVNTCGHHTSFRSAPSSFRSTGMWRPPSKSVPETWLALRKARAASPAFLSLVAKPDEIQVRTSASLHASTTAKASPREATAGGDAGAAPGWPDDEADPDPPASKSTTWTARSCFMRAVSRLSYGWTARSRVAREAPSTPAVRNQRPMLSLAAAPKPSVLTHASTSSVSHAL